MFIGKDIVFDIFLIKFFPDCFLFNEQTFHFIRYSLHFPENRFIFYITQNIFFFLNNNNNFVIEQNNLLALGGIDGIVSNFSIKEVLPQYGAELITNGGFDDGSTGWIYSGDFVISVPSDIIIRAMAFISFATLSLFIESCIKGVNINLKGPSRYPSILSVNLII